MGCRGVAIKVGALGRCWSLAEPNQLAIPSVRSISACPIQSSSYPAPNGRETPVGATPPIFTARRKTSRGPGTLCRSLSIVGTGMSSLPPLPRRSPIR